ncbi:MAG: hypothetical protein ACR2J8_00975, partial [Thermomicrobiales bacterium]
CQLRPCPVSDLQTPRTAVSRVTFTGGASSGYLSLVEGTVADSTFDRVRIEGGCDLTVRDVTLTGAGIIGQCYRAGLPANGRLSVARAAISGAYIGLFNPGLTIDFSGTITGSQTGIYNQDGTIALAQESRVTGNTLGVRNTAADQNAVSGVTPLTVFGNTTNCTGVAGCT